MSWITAFTTHINMSVFDSLPNPHAMLNSNIVLHELIGLLWYRLRQAV